MFVLDIIPEVDYDKIPLDTILFSHFYFQRSKNEHRFSLVALEIFVSGVVVVIQIAPAFLLLYSPDSGEPLILSCFLVIIAVFEHFKPKSSVCKPDFYVLVVFAEFPNFEGSFSECDTNIFRNVTYWHAIVFSNKTSDNNVIVSILLSLNFNANTSNHSWCQCIVRDCFFVFRN